MKTIYNPDDPMYTLFLAAHQNMDANTVSDGRGYRLRMCKEHPCANSHGYVKDHRVQMEKILGRFLYPWELVHHEESRSNNHGQGVLLLTNRSEHNRMHQKYNDPSVIKMVLKAAVDPTVRKSDLPVHKKTIDLICKNHNVVWSSAAVISVDKEEVYRLAKTHSVQEISELLQLSLGILRRRFPEIFPVQRRKIGWLDQHRIAVEDSVAKFGVPKTAIAFDTTDKTIRDYLKRWNENTILGVPLHEQKKEEIFELLRRGVSLTAIGIQFETNRTTIGNSIRRWSNSGVLPLDIVSLLNSDPHRKLKLRYKVSK